MLVGFNLFYRFVLSIPNVRQSSTLKKAELRRLPYSVHIVFTDIRSSNTSLCVTVFTIFQAKYCNSVEFYALCINFWQSMGRTFCEILNDI